MEGQRLLFDRTSWNVSDVQIVRYTWFLPKDKSKHPVGDSFRSIHQVEQLYQVNRKSGGIGNLFVSVQCSECQSDEISNKCGPTSITTLSRKPGVHAVFGMSKW